MRQNVTAALASTCAGRRLNKLMRVIYHAARALLSRVGGVGGLPALTIVSVANHLSRQGGHEERTHERSEGEGEPSNSLIFPVSYRKRVCNHKVRYLHFLFYAANLSDP